MFVRLADSSPEHLSDLLHRVRQWPHGEKELSLSRSKATIFNVAAGPVERALTLEAAVLRFESGLCHAGLGRCLKAAVSSSVKWGRSCLLGLLYWEVIGIK